MMLHPRIDDFERRFTELGQSAHDIARRLRLPFAEVDAALRAAGLEVNGVPPEGCVSSEHACFTGEIIDYTPRYRKDQSLEARATMQIGACMDILGDYLHEHRQANP